MKSINQFDYPSKQSQSFKNYSQIETFGVQDKNTINKTRYKENMQHQMELQRTKVQEAQRKKESQQNKKNKAKIQSQLQKKKKELQNLEVLRQQADQNQRKSYQLARLKQEQDKIKKQEEQRRKKEFDQNATLRFGQAMKRLYQEKQENSFKDRLAEQRRRTADQFERLQRIKAGKYKAYLQEKQQNQQKDTSSYQYKKTLLGNSAFSKSTDYNKSCLHNLKIIPEKDKEQQSAFSKGNVVQEQVRQKSQQRRKRNEQNIRRSRERGKQALLRMQRQRQYSEFEKQTQQEQKKYNLDRIQAGKKNQFIGVKPTTLEQMQYNKKNRSQEEFDKIFFTRPTNLTQSFNQPASKFEIIDGRMPQTQRREQSLVQRSDRSQRLENKKFKNKSYLKEKQESEIPCVSQGKYSFEQPEYSEFRNQSRSEKDIREEDQEHQQNQEEDSHEVEGYNVKNAWKQTGIPNEKYSSSPQQERKPVKKPFAQSGQMSRQNIKQSKITKKSQERQSFNTDEMLRKYGLKRDSPQVQKQKQNPQSKSNSKDTTKAQNKRKVVQLANICQNKQPQKQQLNYSSQSQEDSLM